MSEYIIYATDSFKKIYKTLNKNEKDWIDKIRLKFRESPTGKILKYEWFLEKKYLNKRLCFLLDKENKKILLLSFASKKDQQDIINFVLKNMKELLAYLKNLN